LGTFIAIYRIAATDLPVGRAQWLTGERWREGPIAAARIWIPVSPLSDQCSPPQRF
jgi:hypothetical protein